MSRPLCQFYEFGPFRADPHKRLLLREGEVVPLTPKAFTLLLVFIEKRGEVLDKDELMNAVWPDAVVEENNLTRNISTLRRALGESPDAHQYIVTVPGRGYKFVAEVAELNDTRAEPLPEPQKALQNTVAAENTALSPQVTSPAEMERRKNLLNQRWLMAGAMIVMLALVGLYQLFQRDTGVSAGVPSVRSIAVLPFKPLVAGRRHEEFELGMADTLISKLGSLRHLTVRPFSAVRRYSALETDSLAAGREQKVDAVLEGSIQWEGERVRVTARLLNVADGAILWTHRCEEECTNIFAVQDSISEQMTRALALELTGEERQRLDKRFTSNPAAYQAYALGRFFQQKRTDESLKKSLKYFNEAIASDPSYALPLVGLADSCIVLNSFNVMPMSQSHPLARAAVLRALALDEKLAEAHTSLATIIADYEWNWPEAENHYRRAIELNPNYPTVHHWYAEYLAGVGRFDEALVEAKRAQELDPASLIISADLALIYYWRGQPDQAIEQFQKTLELDANFSYAHEYLGRAYEQKGRLADAVAEYLKAAALDEARQSSVTALKDAYTTKGWRGFWQQQLALQQAQASRRFVSPMTLAAIYARLGEAGRALELLEKAIAERSVPPLYIKLDPRFDSLRAEPGFQELLRRIGVPQ
ncbi:MAG TPA: winged helix-turn-helix domain-containing protein [Blastocatellia bacterium]|nr:winged helix-turn-helix domain-containing protein [Blastocatellia bacterium]